METGIPELKDNLSRYIRRIEAGDRRAITSHGRVVAELVPPAMSRPYNIAIVIDPCWHIREDKKMRRLFRYGK